MDHAQITLLQNMPVFGGLKLETLEFVFARSEPVAVAEGNYFFRQGERGDCLFVIQSGSILVEKHWQGTEVEVGRLEKGDCFGEMALIDLQGRSASVRATSDCTTVKISRPVLGQLYQHDLEQYAIIMMNMGREVSRRLRLLHEKLFVIDQRQKTSPATFESGEMTEVILMSSAFG